MGSQRYRATPEGSSQPNLTLGSAQTVAVEDTTGTVTHILYQPDGSRFATLQNGSIQNYFMPMVNGMVEVFNASGEQYIRHADWLGSSRLATNPNGNPVYDRAYAPFGETYAETGTADRFFTGNTQDVIKGQTGIYDFLFREHSAGMGRWLSPDPAGLAAVDITNPQTWNRYAYVGNNPLSNVDPVGLDDEDHECGGMPCGWPGPGQQLPDGDGPDPCGYICMSPPYPVPIPVGGGGGGGGGTSTPSTPPSSPPSSGPSKPINFPTETNGIPKGLNVNFGGPLGAILPSAICGDMGPCPTVGSDFQAAAAGAIGGSVLCQIAEPCGAIEDILLLGGLAVEGGALIYQMGRTQSNEWTDKAKQFAPQDPCSWLAAQRGFHRIRIQVPNEKSCKRRSS